MKVRTILGLGTSVEQEQPTPLLVLPKCRIGLEYEWENTRMATAAFNEEASLGVFAEFHKYFEPRADGSLRGHAREYVFKDPYSGTKVIKAIETMDDFSRRFEFSGSYRTSLHCHLDMQDVTFPEDVEKFGGLYCIVEPFLYKFVGNNRESSNYCTPWYAHPQHYEMYFSTVLKGAGDANPRDMATRFRNSKQFKYSGLNFFSLGDFGTVEFRQAPVTLQKDKIIAWINIIMRLKKWVLNNPRMTCEDLISYATKKGPVLFLTEVFEEQYKEVTKFSKDVYADFKLGLTTLYQFVALAN